MTLTGTYVIDVASESFRKLATPRMELFNDRLPPVFFPVVFPRPFAAPPAVHLGVSGMKAGGDAFEFTTEPIKISETGFEIRMTGRSSWLDQLHISWLATDA